MMAALVPGVEDNRAVIFLIGVALAIFVIPFPWNIPILVLFAAIEIAETLGTWAWSRRGDPKVGVETLIGGIGRVVSDCRPEGTVRIKGEIWRARCDEGASMGTRVRVTSREELLLIVEALPD
jgi:membrane protein implicated in regulation of membrane protease activity